MAPMELSASTISVNPPREKFALTFLTLRGRSEKNAKSPGFLLLTQFLETHRYPQNFDLSSGLSLDMQITLWIHDFATSPAVVFRETTLASKDN